MVTQALGAFLLNRGVGGGVATSSSVGAHLHGRLSTQGDSSLPEALPGLTGLWAGGRGEGEVAGITSGMMDCRPKRVLWFLTQAVHQNHQHRPQCWLHTRLDQHFGRWNLEIYVCKSQAGDSGIFPG